MLTPIEAIELFNEKADLIHESKLARFYLKTKRLSSEIIIFGKAHEPSEPIMTITEPDSEEMDSVLLKLRFLLDDYDECSYKKLKKIYSELEIPEELKEKYFKFCEELEDFLNRRIIISLGMHTPTYIEIFNTFMYGKHAHSKGKARRRYRQWEIDRFSFPHIKLEFLIAVANILRIVNNIFEINEETINYIKRAK